MSAQVEIGAHLAALREQAGFKQNELARRIEWSPAVLSRVEAGERPLSGGELDKILGGIGTSAAMRTKELLARNWEILPEPPLSDPDADLLWQAEQVAKEIHALAERPDVKQFFERRLIRYKEELFTTAARVAEKRYRVAFIGTIAVGKSTAICRAEKLELPSPKGMPKTVLETGSGGITICEVHLRKGPDYGLIIEPCRDEELRRHVSDFANVVHPSGGTAPSVDEIDGEGEDGGSGISREVERALRSMTGLRRHRSEKKLDGTIIPAWDEARKLAEEFPDTKSLSVELLARMELHKRDRRVLWHTETLGRDPLEWLQEMFELVNNGRHPEFTLPKRIELILPAALLGEEAMSVTLIDTQGIDDVVERADLEQHFDDAHTVVLLCTQFNEAPQTQVRALLRRAREAGVRTLPSHVGLLVLPRSGEALKVKENGVLVDTEDDGYAIKGEEIQLKLNPLCLQDLPVEFFNAADHPPEKLRTFIRERIDAARDYHRRTLTEIIEGARALLANYETEQSLEIMRAASRRLEVWLKSNADVSEIPSGHVQDSLISAVSIAHWRTIAAAVVRTGEWPKLDYPHQLSHGARRIATKMTEPKLTGLKEVADNLLNDEQFEDAFDLIRQCVRAAEDGFDKLIRKVQLVGQNVHADEMRTDLSFWQHCKNISGRGYRDRIADYTRGWFLQQQAGAADRRVVTLVQETWAEITQGVRDLATQE